MISVNLYKNLKGTSGVFDLNVEFSMERGDVLCLYGPSGAGKSSVIRMISGLMKPDQGALTFGRDSWFDSERKINVKAQKRGVSAVFQDYSLFPNMTVSQNLKFTSPTWEERDMNRKFAGAMGIDGLMDQKPTTLSGGQQQRVALARAIFQNEPLILLDEALSAVDYEMRIVIQDLLLEKNQKDGTSIIMTSHDIPEILKTCNKAVCLNDGKVVNSGSSSDIFGKSDLNTKFQFTGRILSIENEDVVSIVSVLIGNERVKVVADKSESENLKVGDNVVVASRSFNPVIVKILP